MKSFSDYVLTRELQILKNVQEMMGNDLSIEEMYYNESFWGEMGKETAKEIGGGLYDITAGLLRGGARMLLGGGRILASPITGSVRAFLKKRYEKKPEVSPAEEPSVHTDIPRSEEPATPEEINTRTTPVFTPPRPSKRFVSESIREDGIEGLRTLMDEDIFGSNALKLNTIVDEISTEEIVQISLTDLIAKLTEMRQKIKENRIGKKTWNEVGPKIKKYLYANKMEEEASGRSKVISFNKHGFELD